jgi:hypothetical protein
VLRSTAVPELGTNGKRAAPARTGKVVTQVRFRLDRSTAAVEADLLNMEFTGGYQLMMLVAPQRMASPASCFWRLITRRNTTIQEGE